jgi:hypothetical protein
VKFSPSLLYQESRGAKSESFDKACDRLFFENVSPDNIFHLLFKNKKNNSFEKKFEIFIDLLAQGADLNKELAENKNLKSELIDFFELENDDEATKYFENKLLFKLKEFKSQLQLIPRLGSIPHCKDLYIKSINSLQKILSFYVIQIKESEEDLLSAEKFFSKINPEVFFSKKQPEEIEHILNFMGFLNYLRDSKFIDFIYEKSEQYMRKPETEMLKEEKEIYNSINILIETLPDCFELHKNQKIHYAKIEEIQDDNSLKYLALRNKFLISIKSLIDNQIAKREEEKEAKKKSDLLKKLEQKERIKIEKKKELEREKLKVEKKAEKARKKEEQRMQKESEEEAKKEAMEKIIKENEEIAKKKAEEKAELEIKKKAEKAKRREDFIKKKQAEENARIEAEERLKIEQENARIEAVERLKIEQENAKIEAEEISKLITKISKKIQDDFEKFDQLFDFLNHSEKWVKPCEIGFYGSRVYGPFVENIFPQNHIENRDLSTTDYDFFCVADGVFACCCNDLIAKENFEKLFEKFNQKNPNFQIRFKEVSGKTNVNLNKFKKSLNFKLVATIDDEDCDFDLNFYSRESRSQNLQWQLNPERIMLCKTEDQFQFVINQDYEDQAPKITIFEFFKKMKKEEDFVLDSNEKAIGFLRRIINNRGTYKYFDDKKMQKIKHKITEKSCEKLIEEIDRYKKFLCIPTGEDDEIYQTKKKEIEAIIKGVSQDHILSRIIQEQAPKSIFSALEAKTMFFKLIENVVQ